jgi:hypothetical protein
MGRFWSLISKLDEWLDRNMTTLGYYRPRCCYCNFEADGRVVCMGRDNQVIDNPFCNHHYQPVYKQTIIMLDQMFPAQMKGGLIYIQRWAKYEQIPEIPKTEIELAAKGHVVFSSDV